MNGIQIPYMGLKGQDVSEAMQAEGIPKGLYITEAIADSPAYLAGIQAGDILTMPAGCRHTVFADSELKIIEVQLGPAISVEDKQKYPLPQA